MADWKQLFDRYYPDDDGLRRLLSKHSRQVADRCLRIAVYHPELQLDTVFLEEAAMLHDIGVRFCHAPSIFCTGEEPYIRHGIIGGRLLREAGLERHARVAERHTGTGLTREQILSQHLPLPPGDYQPETLEEQVVCYADKFHSKSRPDDVPTVDEVARSLARFGREGLDKFMVWARQFALLLALLLCLSAQAAQPSWTKKAAKAVFTLKTFAADGTLLASDNGFFVSPDGTAMSRFQPFKGAVRAVVIDQKGKQWDVGSILGADDSYDVARFRVAVASAVPLSLAAESAAEGQVLTVVPYRKDRQPVQTTVTRVETFKGHFAYYTLALPYDEQLTGCPLLNGEGLVVGIMQPAAAPAGQQSYAVSAAYADSLVVNGLSINDPVMRSTAIRKALPPQLDQALLTLYVASGSLDSTAFAAMLGDFIIQFPTQPDGYVYRARLETSGNNFEAARLDMEKAVDVAEKKDEAHYSYSQLVYQKHLLRGSLPYEPWTLGLALDEARRAYQFNDLPLYHYQEAQVLFAQKEYDAACQIYLSLAQTPFRSPEVFYEAARCKEMLRDTTAQLALLDSTLSLFTQPYLQQAAPFLLARAQVRLDAGRFRDAVNDLNSYEPLMRSQLNDRFYYIRYQAEVGGRLFQQALNDIERAISMDPLSDLYYAEKASLQVRVGLFGDAAESARECIRLAPDYPDGHLFLGLALCLDGKTAEGLPHLQRAKELGDDQAQDFIDRFTAQ